MADEPQSLTQRIAALEAEVASMRAVLKIVVKYQKTNGVPAAADIATIRAYFRDDDDKPPTDDPLTAGFVQVMESLGARVVDVTASGNEAQEDDEADDDADDEDE